MAQTRKKLIARDQMDEYLVMVRQEDPQAPQAGKLLLRIRAKDAPLLCDLAFQIATAPYLPQRDAALANAALNRAEKLSSTNTTEIALDRAILLFQTGQPEAGLTAAKKALATAQTPEAQSAVQTTIRAMQARLAAAKSQGAAGSRTNTVSTANP
jgi:hypothetical protein